MRATWVALPFLVAPTVGLAGPTSSAPTTTARSSTTTVRCDDLSTTDLAIDGLLDDWPRAVLAKAGVPSDGALDLRCSWDGKAFAISLDIKDDRLVRVRGAGHEDHVEIAVGAGGTPAR